METKTTTPTSGRPRRASSGLFLSVHGRPVAGSFGGSTLTSVPQSAPPHVPTRTFDPSFANQRPAGSAYAVPTPMNAKRAKMDTKLFCIGLSPSVGLFNKKHMPTSTGQITVQGIGGYGWGQHLELKAFPAASAVGNRCLATEKGSFPFANQRYILLRRPNGPDWHIASICGGAVFSRLRTNGGHHRTDTR
jgi:hypothetical protein